MTTKDLIAELASQLKLTKKETTELFSESVSVIKEHLLGGYTLQVQNFGSLELKEQASRVIVHPKTGLKMTVPTKRKIVFHPNTKLKKELKDVGIEK